MRTRLVLNQEDFSLKETPFVIMIIAYVDVLSATHL
jgi:hypothetical protein